MELTRRGFFKATTMAFAECMVNEPSTQSKAFALKRTTHADFENGVIDGNEGWQRRLASISHRRPSTAMGGCSPFPQSIPPAAAHDAHPR